MRSLSRIATWLCLSAALAACARSKDNLSTTVGKPDSGASSHAGSSSTDDTLPTPDDNNINVNGNDGDGSAPSLGDNACVNETREAERIDVDLFIMLDRSGSMSESTPNGSTKWADITSALTKFVTAQDTADIGMGLQYFPKLKPGVPDQCLYDAACNGNGPCQIGACASNLNISCSIDSDCPFFNDSCLRVGACASQATTGCAPAGTGLHCEDNGGRDLGECVPTPGFCEAQDSCDSTAYGTPEIPITTGTVRTKSITDSLAANNAFGSTPSAPALQGAVDYAKSWAVAHPSHAVVVLLATDGLPSECISTNPTDDPSGILEVAAIAKAAAEGSPRIRTFVVGVFSATDTAAPGNLNAIAKAGDTDSAFIVDTSGNVSQNFLDTLNTIRSNALSCEFMLPNDSSVDFDEVNLTFDNGNGKSTQLVSVGDRSGCGSDDHTGWYYTLDPTTNLPTQISVCPGVCDDFKATNGGSVKLQIGCKTIIR